MDANRRLGRHGPANDLDAERLLRRLMEDFNLTRDEARAWLDTPKAYLGGKTPRQAGFLRVARLIREMKEGPKDP